MFAAIFGAALGGIETQQKAPAPLSGNAYSQPSDLPGLASDLRQAIINLEDPMLTNFMPPQLLAYLAATKRQELSLFACMSDHDALLALIENA